MSLRRRSITLAPEEKQDGLYAVMRMFEDTVDIIARSRAWNYRKIGPKVTADILAEIATELATPGTSRYPLLDPTSLSSGSAWLALAMTPPIVRDQLADRIDFLNGLVRHFAARLGVETTQAICGELAEELRSQLSPASHIAPIITGPGGDFARSHDLATATDCVEALNA